MAAPSYNQSSTEVSQLGATVPVNYPASGLAADDVAIMIGLYGATANLSVTLNNGFVGLDGTTGLTSNTSVQLLLAWKRLAGTEGGSTSNVTWGSSGAVRRIFWMGIFRGCVASGDPFEAFAGTTGSGTVATAPTCTTTDTDRLVINAYCAKNGVTAPSGYTNFTSAKLWNGSSFKMELMYRTAASAAGYAGDAITVHSSSVEWAAASFALIPVAAAAGQPAAKRPGIRLVREIGLKGVRTFKESLKQLNSGLLVPEWV